jgi:hypothetical protein
LKVCQTAHGEFHADVAATLNNLRVIHRVYGQYAKAEPWLRGLWPSKRNSFGPRPSGRGVECREFGPAARGPKAAGEP